MERLNDRRVVEHSGITANGIRKWGMFLLAASVVGRALIQFRMFGINSFADDKLLDVVNNNMILATAAIVMQACGACAVCIYAFLLVEGIRNTSNIKMYFLRILGIAVISEIPYNLAFSGKLLNFSSCNPMFGLVICMLMLWFYKAFPGYKLQNVLYKLAATVGAIMWCSILVFDEREGLCTVVVALTLWAFQKKPQFRVYAGAMAAILCSIISPIYMIAPVAFLLLHSYNGEKGESNTTLNYLSYPVMLIVVTLIGVIVF